MAFRAEVNSVCYVAQKQIRAFRKKYNISEYKMMWIVLTKGFILGALLMQCQKLITLE